MDTLRATNLSSMLTDCGDKSKPMKLDKDNVSKLVSTFGELSKHEKILFLINIRDFTRDGGSGGVCNGTSTPTIKIEEDTTTPRSSTPTTSTTHQPPATNQSLRLQKTSNWLQKTFIQDTQVALPKEEVYSLYKHEFLRVNEKPISTADFGKLMRQVFPDVKARRLGQRGQSKYCYANIRKRSEIEKPALPTPLPTNELINWAKNKFNIDFSEVTQVVSYLKCESTGSAGRKRRASCGGSLLKQNAGGGGSSSRGKSTARSASVSVLELENKDDPLMILHDNESLEIGSYFQDNNSTQWPQLRSLLTDDSNSSSFSGNFSSAGGVTTLTGGILGSGSKKKRHSSSVQFEFIKPELQGVGLLHRSQSVPVPVNHNLDDELQSTSSTSIFDELTGGSGVSSEVNNPLFSSAATNVSFKNQPVSSTSSCSSNSSVMFESIDMSVGNGGLGGSSMSADINVSGVGDVVGSAVGSLLLSNGGSHVGNDVFFDSVFDLMMNDCQN